MKRILAAVLAFVLAACLQAENKTWFSLSMRTPNTTDLAVPFDFETKAGFDLAGETYSCNLGVLYERELGDLFWGVDASAKAKQETLGVKYDLEGYWYYRQAKQANTGSIRVGKEVFPFIWTGTGCNWLDGIPSITQTFKIDLELVKLEYESNLMDRYLTRIWVGKEFPVWGSLAITPFFQFTGTDGVDEWQFKTTVSVEL